MFILFFSSPVFLSPLSNLTSLLLLLFIFRQSEQSHLQSALQIKWRRRRETEEDDSTYEYTCMKTGEVVSTEVYAKAFKDYISKSKARAFVHSEQMSNNTRVRWNKMTSLLMCREKSFQKITNEFTRLSIRMERIRGK